MIDRLANENELQLFEEMFDDVVTKFTIEGSNLYAAQNNRHSFKLQKFEL